MMSNKDEKWLDELLSDLPKPEKTGDQISAQLDAFLSEQSAKISASSNVRSLSSHTKEKNQRKNWFTQPIGIAASFIVVAAIGFGLISQSNSGNMVPLTLIRHQLLVNPLQRFRVQNHHKMLNLIHLLQVNQNPNQLQTLYQPNRAKLKC
jgi:hypothetical protein